MWAGLAGGKSCVFADIDDVVVDKADSPFFDGDGVEVREEGEFEADCAVPETFREALVAILADQIGRNGGQSVVAQLVFTNVAMRRSMSSWCTEIVPFGFSAQREITLSD